jgi:hypothetical protein
MTINKNFVVKNGFEASTNLIVADADTREVGIGTTNPEYTLHVNGGIGATDLYVSGIATIATINATGVAVTNFNVHNNLSVGGLSTFTNGPVLIGSGTSTETASQPLQVTGGTYVSGNLGIGSTNPTSKLSVVGNTLVTGISTVLTELRVGTGGTVLTALGVGNSIGIGTALPAYLLDIRSSVSTGQTALYVYGDVVITGDLSVDDITLDDATLTNLTVTEALNVTNTGIGTITTFDSTNGTITNLTGTAGTITTFDSTNGTITNLTGTAGTITTFDSTNGTITNGTVTNLTGTAGTITTFNSTTGTITNLNSTNGTITSLTGTAATIGNVIISSGIITATSGIVTYYGDGTYLTGTASLPDLQTVLDTGNTSTTGINVTGVVTATSFIGDGSGLTGTGSTVFNDLATNQEFFPLFTSTTSGTITASGISTSKLTYNPSTGALTAVDLNSTSDVNLKENIKTVENALETVSALRGVSFDWKETGRSSYGVIAQELEEVLPELVGDGDVKSVNYSGIIGVLIEAIKELKKEVENLKVHK